MNLTEIIKRCQRRVGVTPDSLPGIKTWTAIAKALGVDLNESTPVPIVPTKPEFRQSSGEASERVDERSERAIATLHPIVQPKARQLVKLAAANGITIKITSGTRTYEEQDALYAQGRTKPGKIVTGARGGQSSHNFGTAFDVTLFDGNTPVWESVKYRNALAPLEKSLGLSWGGDWSKPDEPHYYLKPAWASELTESEMMAELRRRHNAGIDAFA